MVFKCREVSKINPEPTALPAQDVPAPRVVTGMPTVTRRVEDGCQLLDRARPGHGPRDHPVERGVGGVEGAGEVGCVEDASDAAPPELRGELLDLGGERDGLWHDRV